MEPMKLPPEAWLAINTAIGVIGTLGLAIIGLFQILQNRKIEEVKRIVDGPLSVALKSNAELAVKLAAFTEKPEDVAAAIKATNIADNRKEGKAI